jgi:lysophospholipase L1-like esterase
MTPPLRSASDSRAAWLVTAASRVMVTLLLADVLLLPLFETLHADMWGRLLLFGLGVVTTQATLRWGRVSLMALALSSFGLTADLLVRALIALNVSGIAVNGPEAEAGLTGRKPGASYEWTGQAGLPREFRTVGRWNRWGFNDREPPIAGATPDPIVLILGDSYVEGLQVPESAVFFRVAEDQLRADGHPVRMLGLGESGSGACGAADRLEKLGGLLEPLRPALVVYAFVYNDVRNDYAPWTEDGVAIERRIPAILSRNFATRVPSLDLLRFFLRENARAWIAAHRSRQDINPDALAFADDTVGDVGPAWQATLRCVDRMDRWSRARGSSFAILELPPGNSLYARSACAQLSFRGNPCDPERPRQRLAEHARDNHQEFLTPVEDLRSAWARNERLQFRWDGHYNAAGHRVVGRFLASRLPALLRQDSGSEDRR